MKLSKLLFLLLTLLVFACSKDNSDVKSGDFVTKSAEEGGYTYEYVTNDPTKTRIYTLENGLKVYLSVYKDAPRTHIFIPVKAGGKNDPADNTGLAHYLEHMMFKGTDVFGTMDYEKEKVLLDSIENMFNHYATLTKPEERKEYYKLIDKVSNEAAKYAIPNEYDNMISELGGKGLNAYTTEDRTVYTVDMPSNELERFFEIEGKRFNKIVNRLFHTELEAVYEEKNRSLDSDGWKAYEKLYQLAFEKHPYGTQTVIGTIEHLKNPSITAINDYFNKYYVPNNTAICISGDIDPTKTIEIIKNNFGDWKPNNDLQPMVKVEEDPITEPREAQVFGPDAESLSLAFRFDATNRDEMIKLNLVDMLLNNSEAGLIDLNLSQKQKVLRAGSYINDMNHYALHTFYGNPKEGQTLQEVRDLILEQLELLKEGEFEDWLIDAVVNDLKKNEMQSLEDNWSRADKMVQAFTKEIDWVDYISMLDDMAKVTKEEIVEFVKNNYDNNYVIVYKLTGEDPNKMEVEKPYITKVPLNKNVNSEFHDKLLAKGSQPLTPVFVDYQNEIARGTAKSNIEVLHKKNEENELFELYYLLDIGSNNDPAMKVAVEYLEYIGTEQMKSEDFKKELYKLGASMSVFSSAENTYVVLSGIDENMESAMELFENLITNPAPDQKALDDLVDRQLKSRENAKKNKWTILYSGLLSYAQYGEKSPFTNVLSNAALQNLQAQDLVDKIKNITATEHRILYYGPREKNDIVELINKYHEVPEQLAPLPAPVEFTMVDSEPKKVFWTHYDMVQAEFMAVSKGDPFDKSLMPQIRLFNEYFSALSFQEIREAQGLAYSVFGSYSTPSKSGKNDYLMAYVGTQVDKQAEAMKAITELLENMPLNEGNFQVAKKAILSKIESERITKSAVLWDYNKARDLNLDYDVRKDVYDQVKEMTLDDLKRFHEEHIKNRSYNTVLIGNREMINFADLQNYGEVKELTLDEIFGYESNEKINVEIQ